MTTIKRYINHISLKEGLLHIADPIQDFLSKESTPLESLDISVIPGEYGCYVYQDYENNPRELRLIYDDIFSFVSDEREIVFPEYVGCISTNNYLGVFDKHYNLTKTSYIKVCNFLDEHQDNTYHVNKPWFNSFVFKEKLHNDFEGVLIKSEPKEHSVYIMKNKYRKIVAIRIIF